MYIAVMGSTICMISSDIIVNIGVSAYNRQYAKQVYNFGQCSNYIIFIFYEFIYATNKNKE